MHANEFNTKEKQKITEINNELQHIYLNQLNRLKSVKKIASPQITAHISLRSRRLEVVDTRKNGRARRRHARGEVAPLACLPRARPFSFSPTTSKRLLRRLSPYFHEASQ